MIMVWGGVVSKEEVLMEVRKSEVRLGNQKRVINRQKST